MHWRSTSAAKNHTCAHLHMNINTPHSDPRVYTWYIRTHVQYVYSKYFKIAFSIFAASSMNPQDLSGLESFPGVNLMSMHWVNICRTTETGHCPWNAARYSLHQLITCGDCNTCWQGVQSWARHFLLKPKSTKWITSEMTQIANSPVESTSMWKVSSVIWICNMLEIRLAHGGKNDAATYGNSLSLLLHAPPRRVTLRLSPRPIRKFSGFISRCTYSCAKLWNCKGQASAIRSFYDNENDAILNKHDYIYIYIYIKTGGLVWPSMVSGRFWHSSPCPWSEDRITYLAFELPSSRESWNLNGQVPNGELLEIMSDSNR